MLKQKPAIFILLVFLCFVAVSLSPNGYNTIQAAPKTFLEGLWITLGSLLLLALLRHSHLKNSKHDYLLLIPPMAFIFLGVLQHSNTLAATIHPTLIFFVAFCGVILLRSFTAKNTEKVLLVLGSSIGLCGLLWLVFPSYTDSYINLSQATDRWTTEPQKTLRFPLLVFNPFGGFAQKNIFSVLLSTSIILVIAIIYLKNPHPKPLMTKLGTVALCIMVSYTVGVAGSLTAAAGLVVGILLLLVYFWKQYRRIELGLLLVILGLIAGIYYPPTDSPYVNAVNKIVGENSATDCRILWWLFNFEQFLKNPFFGEGLDSFSGAYMLHAHQTPGVFDVCNSTPSHSHNAIGMIAAETGVFGLVFIVFPLVIWLYLTSSGQNLFLITGIISPIVLHTQTEWPLNASMLTWLLFVAVPIAFSTNPAKPIAKNTLTKGLIFGCLICASSYLVSTLAASRGVSVERYLIERSPGEKQIQMLLDSKYRLHPAFKPVYDIAINRALVDIATSAHDIDALKLVITEYRRSIGPLATPSAIQRLKRAQLVITERQ